MGGLSGLVELRRVSTTKYNRNCTGIRELLARVLVEGTVVVEDVDESEVMPCTDSVIVGVVRGGDLHGTGTELHVDGLRVGDDGHLAAGDEGVDGELAVQVLVARVVGVDGDGSVSKHGFRTGGGNDDLLV